MSDETTCPNCGSPVSKIAGMYQCGSSDKLLTYDGYNCLRRQLAAAHEQIALLREALPDPKKLRLLADWLDLGDVKRDYGDHGVQIDLRRWAEAALAAKEKT
jgi:hypothetical protein